MQRVFTATIFVIIILAGLYTSKYSFVVLFSVVAGLCLWEYLSLVIPDNNTGGILRKLVGLMIGLFPFMLTTILKLNVFIDSYYLIYLTGIFFLPLTFLGFIFELYAGARRPFSNIAFILLGVFYIGFPFALLNFIAFDGEIYYANIVFGLLMMTWVNDTAAYVIGSYLGKTPLLPRISPKKTWEGSIGGIFVTFIFAIGISILFPDLKMHDWMVLSGIVVIFGSVGDLVESMFKRSFLVKDTGSLLPGHGGFLDRFDGFIFLLPFAAAYILLIR